MLVRKRELTSGKQQSPPEPCNQNKPGTDFSYSGLVTKEKDDAAVDRVVGLVSRGLGISSFVEASICLLVVLVGEDLLTTLAAGHAL
jgi:hypothetical protein